MSPERINNEPYSFPADIWSLGLALLECGTGVFPYNATTGPVNLMLQVKYILCKRSNESNGMQELLGTFYPMILLRLLCKASRRVVLILMSTLLSGDLDSAAG